MFFELFTVSSMVMDFYRELNDGYSLLTPSIKLIQIFHHF